MGKHGKGGGGSAHDRALKKAAEKASHLDAPVISDERQTDSQESDSRQNSGRFYNRSASISIAAISIALLLWAFYPTVLTSVVSHADRLLLSAV